MTPAVERLAKRIMSSDEAGGIDRILSLIESRPASCRDADGRELARLMNWLYLPTASSAYLRWLEESPRRKQLLRLVTLPDRRGYWNSQNFGAMKQLMAMNFELVWDFQLDLLQAACAGIPSADHNESSAKMWLQSNEHGSPGYSRDRFHAAVPEMNDQQLLRYWQLRNWLQRGLPGLSPSEYSGTDVESGESLATFRAYDLGEATDGDLAQVLFRRPLHIYSRIEDLPQVVQRRRIDFLRVSQAVAQDLIADEYSRTSDTASETTKRTYYVNRVFGLDYLLTFLEQLDAEGFLSRSFHDNIRHKRAAVRSHLIRSTMPEAVGTGTRPRGKQPPGIHKPSATALADFAKRITPLRHNGLSDTRLLELAFHSPQWAWYVEHTLDLEGLAETVYWCHCSLSLSHFPKLALESDGYIAIAAVSAGQGGQDRDEDDREAPVEMQALDLMLLAFTGHRAVNRESEYGITFQELPEEISHAWAERIRSRVPADRWKLFLSAMKVAGTTKEINQLLLDIGGTGTAKSRKVKLLDLKQVLDGIEFRHRKSAVEQLAKIPLATGTDRNADIIERFRVLSLYRQFYVPKAVYGEDAQDSLVLVDEAFHDLAELAGLPREEQLHWLVGCSLPERLNKLGPGGQVTEGNVSVTLRIDESALPVVDVFQNNKKVRSIPKDVQQLKSIKDLKSLQAEIKQLTTIIRGHFEHQSMLHGTTYVVREFLEYHRNPILKTLCENLVFVKEAGVKSKKAPQLGYLVLGEPCYLVNHSGQQQVVSPKDVVRLAHPVDFDATGEWDAWKQSVLSQQRVEPFRQVTQEHFAPTAEEIQRTQATNQEAPRKLYDSNALYADGKKYGVLRFEHQPLEWMQLRAVLHKQGWVNSSSDIYLRFWSDYTVVAHVEMQPGKVFGDGDTTVVRSVTFYRPDRNATSNVIHLFPLNQIPPRYFSQAIREINMAVAASRVKKS